jgi:uncharacterized protein DUF3187
VTDTRPTAVLVFVLSLGFVARGVAQSFPVLHSINPMVESRTAVYFQPYVSPGARWRIDWGVDYASIAELGLGASTADTAYLIDAEVLRADLGATRNLNGRYFVTGGMALGGAYAGALDGFLDWYHGLFGIRFPERDNRRHNQFAYRVELPGRPVITRQPRSLFLMDSRIGIGRRHGEAVQTVLSLTLPTSTAPDGYGRGTVGLGVLNTARGELTPRLSLEASANLGYTPRHGPLSPFQNQFGMSLTTGVSWRFWGRLSAFGNFYFATPYYHSTDIRGLDRHELTLDFGWTLATHRGREWRIGMTEDPNPTGPAIDLDFRVGGRWKSGDQLGER